MIDGVFAAKGEGVSFHPAARLTRDDVKTVVAVAARRIERLLQRRGLKTDEGGASDAWTDGAPVLARLTVASVQGRIALGPVAGTRVARYGSGKSVLL